jgi:peptidoglycan-associated lipoprotein
MGLFGSRIGDLSLNEVPAFWVSRLTSKMGDITMKRLLLVSVGALALAALVTACGSSVKLTEAPVEDRNISGAAGAQTAGSTAGQADANRTAQAGSGVVVAPAAGGAISAADLNARKGPAPVPANLARIIYFDYDSFEIKPQFQPVVQGHAQYLSANKERKLALEGHTDERGGREYNLALGQKRAEAVRRALSVLGVADAQLEATSFG